MRLASEVSRHAGNAAAAASITARASSTLASATCTGDLTGRRIGHRRGSTAAPGKGLLSIQCVMVCGIRSLRV